MRPIHVTVTGVAASDPIQLNTNGSDFVAGVAAVITGTATYDVQFTMDGTTWFNHPDFTAVSANKAAKIDIPAAFYRLNVTASTGSVKLSIVQNGV